MRTLLNLLIFLQTLIGISIIVYCPYVLNQWGKQFPIPPSPPSPSLPPPSPVPSPYYSVVVFNIYTGKEKGVIQFDYGAGTVTGIRDSNPFPTPWFIYAFMCLGAVLSCTSCMDHIAAEAINGCCLGFYTLLKAILILLEVGLVASIANDKRWEKDLPTGEMDSAREFIQDNVDLCKWVGIVIILIQAVCLLAILLGTMQIADEGCFHLCEYGGRFCWFKRAPPKPTFKRKGCGSVSNLDSTKTERKMIFSLRIASSLFCSWMLCF